MSNGGHGEYFVWDYYGNLLLYDEEGRFSAAAPVEGNAAQQEQMSGGGSEQSTLASPQPRPSKKSPHPNRVAEKSAKAKPTQPSQTKAAAKPQPSMQAPAAAVVARAHPAAPSFYPQCLQHLTRGSRLFAPPGTPRDQAEWASFAERLQGAHDQISTISPAVADRFLSRAWGHGIAHSARNVNDPTGDLLDAVGEIGAPHVRAVTAQQLWQLEHKTPRSLSEWSNRIGEVMARRGSKPTQNTGGSAHARPDGCNYWQQLLPGEEALPRVTFLGLCRRAHSTDPVTDQLISLLESAARSPEAASESLLGEALRHEAPLVRWTAAGLLPIFNPDHAGLVAARSDPDALVRARAGHGALRGCQGASDSGPGQRHPAKPAL